MSIGKENVPVFGFEKSPGSGQRSGCLKPKAWATGGDEWHNPFVIGTAVAATRRE